METKITCFSTIFVGLEAWADMNYLCFQRYLFVWMPALTGNTIFIGLLKTTDCVEGPLIYSRFFKPCPEAFKSDTQR